MFSHPKTLDVVLAFVLAVSCVHAADPAAPGGVLAPASALPSQGPVMSKLIKIPHQWGVPTGWRTEVIPFPLDFAPSLPYQGLEELRFSPDFGKADRPLFFTYAFVWAIKGDQPPSVEQLSKDMKVYFDGLMIAVAKSNKIPNAVINTKVELQPDTKAREHVQGDPWRLLATGSIWTYDSFFTKKSLQLDCRFYVPFGPPRPKDQIVYFEGSPQLGKAEIEQALRSVRLDFKAR